MKILTEKRCNTEAVITNIKRFAVHDGDGIRSTVFFKGCSLKCIWCHNPETISLERQLMFYRHKCSNCGKCSDVCSCNFLQNGDIDREKCDLCGKCVSVCLNGALEISGKKMTVDEIFDIVIKDKKFYDESGGGVTLSGGECLLQADFCAELLKKIKEENINTAVDTCGMVSRSAIGKVMPYTDVFLYDIKAIDENVHIKCTGKSNKIILENLKYIDSCGKKTEIRIPYVPEYNSGEKEKIIEFLKELNNIVKIRVLPYHNYAATKYEALGMKNTLPEKLPEKEEIEMFQKELDEAVKT